MDFLKKTILTFIYILAGITISSALFITLFASEFYFSIQLLWQIICMSMVCALGNLIFYSKHEISKQKMKIRMAVHYLFINGVVLGGAYLLGWLAPGIIPQILTMILLIAAVYAGVALLTYKQEAKTAENLNERLRKFHPTEEKEDVK